MENGETEADYRRFIETFCNEIDCLSQDDNDIPFRLSTFYLVPSELEGECLEWIRHYLSMHCPSSLLPQLTRAVFTQFDDAVRLSEYFVEAKGSADQSTGSSDGDSTDDDPQEINGPPQLDAAKLLSKVVSHVHDILRLWRQSPPTFVTSSTSLLVSSYAIKNSRRKMEDKHVVITDLNTLYNLKDSPPQSYFAIFDGHGGLDAATYAATHLHGHMLSDKLFGTDPASAMKQAYKTTDIKFLEKAKRENLRSGTTGISALIRDSSVYLGWLGDSQAIIVRGGRPVKIMDPHKPEREDEKRRIEGLGGCVLFIGTWRVNGNIAVSRAIGDATHKPFISSDADVTSIPLTREDEYLVIACDGLWDVLDPSQVTHLVYDHVQSSPGGVSGVATTLVNAARDNGSSDNISVIVVFFKTSLCDPNSVSAASLQLGLNELTESQPNTFSSPSSSPASAAANDKDRKNLRLQKDGQSKDASEPPHVSSLSSSCCHCSDFQQHPASDLFISHLSSHYPVGLAVHGYMSPEKQSRRVRLKPSFLKKFYGLECIILILFNK
ncbi:Protein phosphatase 1E [Bulinus truncatus]|nr:Protein phosphatase 1E [Bulinus truncatus]